MAEDISNRTVLILVLLTILVSTLGTLTVMDSVNKAETGTAPVLDQAETTGSGKVILKIKEPAPVITGQVILNIIE